MTVALPEPISIAIFERGEIEPEVTAALIQNLKDRSVFFDVGAHVGYFTLLASRLVGPTGRIVSFEPTPASRAVLEKNVRGRVNVQIEPVAVWSEDTTLTFRDYSWRFSALNSAFEPRSRPDEPVPAPKTYEVDAITLDGFVERTGLRPDFVKIDAESAEHRVLQGMEQTLRHVRPVVTVEVGDVDIPGAADAPETLRYLTDRDYVPMEYVDGAFVPHRIRDDYSHGNVVLLPR